MNAIDSLTKADILFFDRMASYMHTGMSFDDSAMQVCIDDKKIHASINKNKLIKNAVTSRLTTHIWTSVNTIAI